MGKIPQRYEIWQHQKHNPPEALHIYSILGITDPSISTLDDLHFIGEAIQTETGERLFIYQNEDACTAMKDLSSDPHPLILVIYQSTYHRHDIHRWRAEEIYGRPLTSFMGDRNGKPRFIKLG